MPIIEANAVAIGVIKMSPDTKDEAFLKETDALHNLRALEEIEKNPKVSQRELSNHLGVALGITNALLKTLVRKGQIKVRGENNRSLTYHVTHAGVLAKSRLAMRWTLNTIEFYRSARRDVAEKMAAIAADGVKTVVLYGLGEMTEIALIVASEVGLEVKGFVDGADISRGPLLGLPVGDESLIDEIKPDAVIVCAETDQSVLGDFTEESGAKPKVYYLVRYLEEKSGSQS